MLTSSIVGRAEELVEVLDGLGDACRADEGGGTGRDAPLLAGLLREASAAETLRQIRHLQRGAAGVLIHCSQWFRVLLITDVTLVHLKYHMGIYYTTCEILSANMGF